MPQSQSTAFPSHQKTERWETNKDKTNATYETTDKNKTATEESPWKGKLIKYN